MFLFQKVIVEEFHKHKSGMYPWFTYFKYVMTAINCVWKEFLYNLSQVHTQ